MARRGENIRKRKDGRWEGRYSYIPAEGADSKICSVYARTYREVREKLAEAKRMTNELSKAQPDEEDMLFTDIADQWLSSIAESQKYSTYVKYRQVYDKYLRDFLEGQTISTITSEMMETDIIPNADEKIAHGKLTDSLEKSIYCVTNQILAFAAKKYHIAVKTMSRERQKNRKKPVQVFNTSEQQTLADFLNQDMDLYKFGIVLCLYTGLRIGELCALKWSDIDMDNRIIRVTATVQRLPVTTLKSDHHRTELIEMEPKSYCSRREIPICDALLPLLSRFSHPDKYVIGREKAADPRTYQKKFAAYLRSAGIEHRSFHTLRHTFASNCAACGTDAKALSEILGHASVQITLNRYVHPSMMTKRSYLNLLQTDFCGQKMGQAV